MKKILTIICLISLNSCYDDHQDLIVQKEPCDPSKFSDNWQVEYVEGYPIAYKNTCGGTIYMHKRRTGSFMSFKESRL